MQHELRSPECPKRKDARIGGKRSVFLEILCMSGIAVVVQYSYNGIYIQFTRFDVLLLKKNWVSFVESDAFCVFFLPL